MSLASIFFDDSPRRKIIYLEKIDTRLTLSRIG